MSTVKSTLAPVLFLSHGAGPAAFLNYKGSPFQDFDSSSPSAAFLRNLKKPISEAYNLEDIKSIVVVSAHWEEREFTVDYQTGPTKLLYDYGGFPTEAYAPHLTYPVPTDPSLAQHVHQLLTAQGVKNAIRSRGEGFDHGVFIPLKLAFPEATIPVVQVSLNRNLDIASHIKLGEALAPLRKEGVLIIGSGQITHNMGASRSASGKVDPRAIEFTDHFKALLEGTTESNYEERKQALIASPALAPHFDYEHPRTEHFIPLVVAFGAATPGSSAGGGAEEGEESCAAAAGALQVRRLFHHVAMGSMATDAYIFTNSA